MISQQQNNIHMPEEETAPSLEQKQPSAPTSSWRSWSLWLRRLGVVMPLVCGIGIFIWSSAWTIVIVPFIGFVSACLFRSWWAMLIVPAVFIVGLIPGLAIIFGGFENLYSQISALADPGLFWLVVFIGVVPFEICVAIGTPIGKWIEKRVRH